MKATLETDKQNIERIIIYINDMKTIIKDMKSYTELENSVAEKYAITQLITNIYETISKLQKDTFKQLKKLKKIRLYETRNISSHHYIDIDFKIIFDICQKLTTNDVKFELEDFINAEQ